MKKVNGTIIIATLILAVATILTLNVVIAGNLNSNVIDVSASVEQTKLIQQQLVNFGYYDGEVDGFYDDETKTAILEFQKDKGINQTGVVDASTALALELEAAIQTVDDIYLLAKII
ncbi:MAG: peptidoglycan-binding domain-containing protein, partial [Clostridia bacterium]|nr:peptidoglycan-binding domain-containing protein [Clostridia bacterium]